MAEGSGTADRRWQDALVDALRSGAREAGNRFLGVDPATGETDYWKRGGLAGMLGMEPWYNTPREEIAMGFAGSTTPKVGKAIRAYHGSPHDFDKFDLSKIGTGEGAQAYGHGLYFAENEGVARGYRDNLAKDMYYGPSGKMFDPQAQLKHLNVRVAARNNGPDLDATIARAQELLPKASAQTRPMIEHDLAVLHSFRDAGGIAKNPGRMYEVDIHADPSRFLDWDAPFAQQHGDVREAINDLWKQKGGSLEGRTLPPFSASETLTTGESLYPAIATTYGKGGNARLQEAGSNALRDRGIPGIKYLDQGSRNSVSVADASGTISMLEKAAKKHTGDEMLARELANAKAALAEAQRGQSRNYVVFDDSLISILRKYGLLGMIGGGAAASSDIRAFLDKDGT